MSTERGNFWSRAWRHGTLGQTMRPSSPDFADMGTAFGLDATFDPAAAVVPPSSVAKSAKPLTENAANLPQDTWATRRLNGRSVI